MSSGRTGFNGFSDTSNPLPPISLSVSLSTNVSVLSGLHRVEDLEREEIKESEVGLVRALVPPRICLLSEMCNGRDCRREAAFRWVELRTAEREKTVPGGGRRSQQEKRPPVAEISEAEKCARAAEKEEKLLHLICWGPR